MLDFIRRLLGTDISSDHRQRSNNEEKLAHHSPVSRSTGASESILRFDV